MAQASVFEQVIKIIPRPLFESIAHKYNADRGTRTLSSWSWFGALLFGQLSGHDSIRAIERVFCQGNKRIKKLGFTPVARSTLADANHLRPQGLLQDLFESLVIKARGMTVSKKLLELEGKEVFLMDSTTIQLALSLCPWAKVGLRAGVKLHTAIDLAGEIPAFAVITPSRVNDLRVARQLHFKQGSTIVFDRGYLDQRFFNKLSEEKVFFVTRAKKNNKFKIEKNLSVDRTQGILSDKIIYGKDRSTRMPTGHPMRRIEYLEPDTKKLFVFLTNHLNLSAKTVADLYKARWKVELFFKSLKQNLKIRKFLGNSASAVKAQILVALIAYLLVYMIRTIYKSKISMPDAMAVLGTLLLLNEPLVRLLGKLPRVIRHPPDAQLALPI